MTKRRKCNVHTSKGVVHIQPRLEKIITHRKKVVSVGAIHQKGSRNDRNNATPDFIIFITIVTFHIFVIKHM